MEGVKSVNCTTNIQDECVCLVRGRETKYEEQEENFSALSKKRGGGKKSVSNKWRVCVWQPGKGGKEKMKALSYLL